MQGWRVVGIMGVLASGCWSAGRPADSALVGVPIETGSGFASMVRRPGGSVPLHPPVAPLPVRPEPSEPTPSRSEPQTLPTAAVAADPPLVNAVRAELVGRPDALEYLAGLPPANREVLTHLVPAVVRAAGVDLTRPGTLDLRELSVQLAVAQAQVADRAPLVLKPPVLAARIDGFARYQPVPEKYRYPVGLGVAQLYVELHNVRPAAVGTEYEARVAWTLKLTRSGTDSPLEHRTDEYHVPRTRTPIRDCFVPLSVPIPSVPGDYLLTIEVRDLNRPQGAFTASGTVRLHVGSPGGS